jgi:Uma2 family endonuclease
LLALATERGLGHVLDSSTGFRLPGGNVRSPDAAFVAAARLGDAKPPDDFGNLAPDLALEVLSPGDRPRHALDSVGEDLEAGVGLVWVIDPERRCASVYRSLTQVRELGPDGELDGEEMLPGFRCRLADILD